MENNNTDMQNESLEDAAKANSKLLTSPEKHFINGANWQKEKDKAVIDKALGIVKTCKFWFGNEANYSEGTNGYNLAKECEELLQSIEKETI